MEITDLSRKILGYLQSMTDSQILKAKKLQNENTLSFLYFTDPHISTESSFTDIDTLNYINRNLKTEFTACCGDNFDNVASKQHHLDTAAKFMNNLNIEKFFTVKGNHDDNSIQSEGIDNIRYTMLPQEQYDIMFRRLEGIVKFDDLNKYGLYYYYDAPKSKVRAIFLNSIDIPYMIDKLAPSAWKYSGQSNYAYSDAQLNWLANTALKLPSKDWKVILFTHINPFSEGVIGADKLAHNSSVLLGIIDAFKSGTSYEASQSAGDFAHQVSIDFSSQGNGKVIAFFYGHTHSEQVLSREGIKYIGSWNDCPRKAASNPNAPTRITGTISEICLNAVTVDSQQNRIFITKFGVGDDLIIDIE